MNRKRLLLLIASVFLTITAKAQISTCAYYDGYWGKWKQRYVRWPSGQITMNDDEFRGNYSGFIIYDKSDHPSQYFFKFQINNYVPPTKQQIKEHYKKNEWYEYSGTVEYFVVEDLPTIKDILKEIGFPLYHKDIHDGFGNYAVKRVANATIKIAPYKKHPETYNFWFDNVGLAISLDYIEF